MRPCSVRRTIVIIFRSALQLGLRETGLRRHHEQRGFLYLFAVLDWTSRRVLAWRLSNTLTTNLCPDAVREAITQ
jgi:hypothetical protein